MKNAALLNQEIEQLINQRGELPDSYTDEEKAMLKKYSGSGGLAAQGASGEGVLYEFYSPEYISDQLWRLAYYYGFTSGGTVLDPATGCGSLIEKAPNHNLVTAFEINPTSAKITRILYPGVTVYNHYFETAFLTPPRFVGLYKVGTSWLEQAPFDLVIANPPYGKYRNFYSSFFSRLNFKQIELFFMYQSLRLLKPGGLYIAITSSNFLRNSYSYNEDKRKISSLATLLTAYRLPPVFERSQVPTDLLVLKRI